jgi:hypothetical protein
MAYGTESGGGKVLAFPEKETRDQIRIECIDRYFESIYCNPSYSLFTCFKGDD